MSAEERLRLEQLFLALKDAGAWFLAEHVRKLILEQEAIEPERKAA